MKESLQEIDRVLLVSGMTAPDKRIEQHRNVIEAAQAAGVSKIVYTSIQGAEDGTAFSPIVQSNRQTESEMTVEEYRQDRIDELGEFLGVVIAGIYQGIQNGAADNEGHVAQAAGREHLSWPSFFDGLR